MGSANRCVLLAMVLAFGACQCGDDPRAGGAQDPDRWKLDSGVHPDGGPRLTRGDGGAGGTDAGGNESDGGNGGGVDGGNGGGVDGGNGGGVDGGNGGTPDAGNGGTPDAGNGGTPDAGNGGTPDAGNGGTPDAGNGGTPDAGNGGTPDAGNGGTPDSGVTPGFGDVWIEISYVTASSPSSPRFTYSVSPGWTAASWDFRGSRVGGAEAWDRFNNMSIVNDPIGTSLAIGGSSQLQLMLGLVPLISYTGATVELEGRSRATSSPVNFAVTNPLNGCGGTASMDQDWTPDIVQVDLSGCYIPGGDVQAVRVNPTSGTIALRRMRLTLHGARW